MPRQTNDPAPIASVGDHAEESLQFIRRTLERSATFTAVPGIGGAAMGAIGIAAAVIASRQPSPERWLLVWLAAAVVALAAGLLAVRAKAARQHAPVPGAVARRFAMAVAAPIVAGAALTWRQWMHGDWASMPPMWLLLYGTGVVAAGTLSVAAVRLLGVAIMGVGIAALVAPPAWGDFWLGVGFGGLQIAFGLYIARKHGG